MAVCSHTGITIPECSCNRCVEDQIRRNMPVLLDQATGGPLPVADQPQDIRVTRTGGRRLLGRLRRRPRATT
jgi:hypothetical protein